MTTHQFIFPPATMPSKQKSPITVYNETSRTGGIHSWGDYMKEWGPKDDTTRLANYGKSLDTIHAMYDAYTAGAPATPQLAAMFLEHFRIVVGIKKTAIYELKQKLLALPKHSRKDEAIHEEIVERIDELKRVESQFKKMLDIALETSRPSKTS